MAPKTLVWSPAEEDTRAMSLELEWSGFMVCLNVFTTLLRSGREKDELNRVWDWLRSVGGVSIGHEHEWLNWIDLFIHSESSKPVCDRGICFLSYRIIFLWDLVSCVEMQLRRGPHLRDSPDFLGTSVGEERKSHRRVSSPWLPDWQASVLSIELKPKAVKESLNQEHLVISQP